MVVLVRFLLSRIINRSPLLDTGVVALPLELSGCWEAKDAFQRVPGKSQYT